MQDNDAVLRQYGAKYGLFLGIILLAVSLGFVYLVAGVNLSPVGLVLIMFSLKVIVPIALGIAFVLWLRTTVGGYWNLKQATTGIFFMFYMASLINYIGYDIAFTHIISPATVQKAGENTVNVYEQAQRLTKVPNKEAQETIKSMRASLKQGYVITPATVVSYLITSVLLIFVISLVFAALFKREPPVLTRQPTEGEY
jgi:hypothetical protein